MPATTVLSFSQYLYVWHDGKHIKRYIGKTLPRSATRDPDGQTAGEPGRPDSARPLLRDSQ
jgi:hypothetical protein